MDVMNYQELTILELGGRVFVHIHSQAMGFGPFLDLTYSRFSYKRKPWSYIVTSVDTYAQMMSISVNATTNTAYCLNVLTNLRIKKYLTTALLLMYVTTTETDVSIGVNTYDPTQHIGFVGSRAFFPWDVAVYGSYPSTPKTACFFGPHGMHTHSPPTIPMLSLHWLYGLGIWWTLGN